MEGENLPAMERLLAVKLVVVLGLGWGLWAARRAWVGQPRRCPRAPLWSKLRVPEKPLYAALWLLLAGIAAQPQRDGPISLFLAVAALGCLADWTRFRPWMYQNGAILLALQHQNLDLCRLIIISIYFWAGALKLNRTFVTLIFPWVVGPLAQRLPPRLRQLCQPLGHAVPWIEAGLGLGLLFPATRPLALSLATGMHALILACFSRWGHTSYRTIWPWNLSMLGTAWALFWGCPEVGAAQILCGDGSLLQWAGLVLFAGLPALGLWNRLDPVFSHGHMTGRHVYASVALTRRFVRRLPAEVQPFCQRVSWGPGRVFALDISQWYLAELKVPPPQQERLLLGIARHLAQHGAEPEDIELVVFRMPGWRASSSPQGRYSGPEIVDGGTKLK